MKSIGFVPGQHFRRFYGTYAYRMRRRALEIQREQSVQLGGALFGQTVERSMGFSELAAQQAIRRVQAAAGNLGATLERLRAETGNRNVIA